MKPIDSILKILRQQDGNELKLASDRRPQMFKDSVELPLTIPPMSTEQIRKVLDDLWTEHASTVGDRGEAAFTYASAELGTFVLTLRQPDDSTLEVSVRRDDGATRDDVGPATDSRRETALAGADAAKAPDELIALVTRAIARGASDIHLSPRRPPVVRINGELQTFDGSPGFDATPLIGGHDRVEHVRTRGSIDRAFDVPGIGRLRVNVYASEEGLCAAVRILRKQAPALGELNLPPHIASLGELPHGLIVACGPTGCGKSTTLAALVEHVLRARPQVLVTFEDPIEYVIRPHAQGLVRQREVGTHVRDFATGLRDALREDPDMLLIGEMRDPETIGLALTAAETGHLVFTSLHSRTAPSAVERIIDTYAPERQRQIRVQLADSLRAVISQRLIPTADGSGRVPAVEVLRVTDAVANLIRDGRTAQIVNALQAGAGDGMVVLERNLADLVRAGRIRRETAVAAANDPASLNEYLRSGGHA
ncbi:MAG TPA: PilT/PilU family type 4a pilus ATPase [Candidatus Binatia bacterium]|nr:PilT/PilU family type 4a pilus ATPase [Candidatus Binatia bacterium]